MRTWKWTLGCVLVAVAAGCGRPPAPAPAGAPLESLAEARKGFVSKLNGTRSSAQAPPTPPAGVFDLVSYDAPVGKLPAYLTPDSKDGKKRPAIVWITGGDCNTIDAGCWKEGPPANDQSAAAYRKAGVVMLFPSLRGGNANPGFKESFLGEVDDVLAAADFLAKQPHVDPARIYLGGHSTGGTLVLLVAECSDRFKAVFSFGPVYDPLGYGREFLFYDPSDPKEERLRMPGRWTHSLRTPTFAIEGANDGNADQVQQLQRASGKRLTGIIVPRADHFSVLAPANRVIAQKIAAGGELTLTADEVIAAFAGK